MAVSGTGARIGGVARDYPFRAKDQRLYPSGRSRIAFPPPPAHGERESRVSKGGRSRPRRISWKLPILRGHHELDLNLCYSRIPAGPSRIFWLCSTAKTGRERFGHLDSLAAHGNQGLGPHLLDPALGNCPHFGTQTLSLKKRRLKPLMDAADEKAEPTALLPVPSPAGCLPTHAARHGFAGAGAMMRARVRIECEVGENSPGLQAGVPMCWTSSSPGGTAEGCFCRPSGTRFVFVPDPWPEGRGYSQKRKAPWGAAAPPFRSAPSTLQFNRRF